MPATNYRRKAARLVRQAELHFERGAELAKQAAHERKLGRSLIRAAELACPNTSALASTLAELDRKAAHAAMPSYAE